MTTAQRFGEIREAYDQIDQMHAWGDRDAYKAWSRNVGDTDFINFEDSYQGTHDSELDFTEQLVEDLGMLDSMPDDLRYYFDYESFSRDLFMTDYFSVQINRSTVYVFRSL